MVREVWDFRALMSREKGILWHTATGLINVVKGMRSSEGQVEGGNTMKEYKGGRGPC